MNQNNTIALSIFIGFLLVAGAIFFSGNNFGLAVNSTDTSGEQVVTTSKTATREENRYVYGNSDAPTTIVEFSDYECPFCSRLHPTLEKIVDESDGAINWEFRHLPLPSHKNAEVLAFIGECVGVLAGNDAFWSYTKSVFANQQSIDDTFLNKTTEDLGVPKSDLEACVNDDATRTQIETDLATARALGGSGTPFNVIVREDGSKQAVSGALPYESWKEILDL